MIFNLEEAEESQKEALHHESPDNLIESVGKSVLFVSQFHVSAISSVLVAFVAVLYYVDAHMLKSKKKTDYDDDFMNI